MKKIKDLVNSTPSPTYSISKTCLTIVRTVLYFDVFKFPLLMEEIQRYIHPDEVIEEELDNLVKMGIIFTHANYYGIGNLEENVKRRKDGKTEAEKSWKTAKKVSKFLAIIPFIRCVCISGSLSKDYMDQTSDIDYFIIVKANRLWIVRAIFSFFILGFGIFKIKKYFCPNYIIVDTNLEIKDKNIFTATEICTLIPLYNMELFQKFISKNQWVSIFIPNPKKNQETASPERKHLLHLIWNSYFCEVVDNMFFSIYRWHYGRKFKNLSDWKLTKLDINVSKNNYKMHSTGHRGKILTLFDQKIELFSKKFQIDLNQKFNA